MMGVIRADQLADAGRRLARVFVDGFGHRLTYFSKDPVRLVAAFAHMFRTDCFFVAIEDGAVAAMAGITDGNEPAVELNAAHLRRELGLLRGSIATVVLTKAWRRGYPIPIGDDWGSIQFVAAAADQRRRGGARAVMEHIIERSGHTTYVLEVGDRNTAAVALYESLGFLEIARVPDRDSKHSGYDYLIYLRLDHPRGCAPSAAAPRV